MKFKQWLLSALLAFAATQALACYTVYDRNNRVVYQGQDAPVDMSRPLHETMPSRFPGGHLVFDLDAQCPAVVALAPVRGGTPLLTNVRTAQAMQVPHVNLAGGIALVQPRDAAVRPGLTVLPSTAFAAAPSTRAMGAGPAPRH